MKKILMALMLCFVCSSAFAAVPVARTDNFLEKLFLARYQEMQTWLENVAFSITNPKTLGDLIALPDKLKSLGKSLDRLTDFGDVTGKITGELLTTGNKDLAAGNKDLGDMRQYVNLNDIASGNFDRLTSKAINALINALKKIKIDTGNVPGSTEQEKKDMAASAAKASVEAATETVNTVPLSVPAIETAAASKIVAESPSAAARKQNVLNTASGAKLKLMEEYASYIARYSGEDSAHRKKVQQIMNETQKIVESSKEYASTVGKMEAQQAIARVGADQIAMLAMQNVMLANMTDILADEVVLLSKIGLAETEEYAGAIKKTLEDYIDIYSGIRGQ